MPTQSESVCCHEIEQIRSLLEDSHIEIPPSCITLHADFYYIRTYASIKLCLLFLCMHIDIGMNVLKFLQMKIGIEFSIIALFSIVSSSGNLDTWHIGN